jgi:ribosomal protein S27E
MKIPDVTALSSISINIIQSNYPILFEQSFQTVTSSSLCWIDQQFDNELDFVRIDDNTAKAATTVCTYQVDIEEDPGDNNHEEEEIQQQQQQQQQPRNIIIAKIVIRRIVYKCLNKYSTISSKLEVEEALKYYALPKDLQEELFSKYGGTFKPQTWYDAIHQLQNYCTRLCNNDKNNNDSNNGDYLVTHPITSYVPVQCQSCGHIIPDEYNTNNNDDANIGLTEVEPTSEEQPFVRTGWFRGPRLQSKVFELDCPKCDHVSRWYRSSSSKNYIKSKIDGGRLCGVNKKI